MSDLRIVHSCDICRSAIEPGTGYIMCDTREADRYLREQQEWEAAHEIAPGVILIEGSDLLDGPDPARWTAMHRRCDPNLDGCEYWFDVERADTPLKLLDWTAHLLDKVWFGGTDWAEFLRRSVLDPAGVDA